MGALEDLEDLGALEDLRDLEDLGDLPDFNIRSPGPLKCALSAFTSVVMLMTMASAIKAILMMNCILTYGIAKVTDEITKPINTCQKCMNILVHVPLPSFS